MVLLQPLKRERVRSQSRRKAVTHKFRRRAKIKESVSGDHLEAGESYVGGKRRGKGGLGAAVLVVTLPYATWSLVMART